MALASQVAGANQPPLLSSPAHRLPTRASSNNALLLLQPGAVVRNLRLSPAGARRAQLDAVVVARASSEAKAAAETKSSGSGGEGAAEEEERPYEEYEVTIQKPYGLKFTKGRDGGTYIEAIQPGGAADLTGQFEVGDKVLATSSVFGDEIWPAAGYGQTMYCIRQRIGPLYMKMERRFGKWDGAGDLTEKEIIRFERNSGVVSGRVREIQLQNYTRKMEQKMQREADLRTGLKLYKEGKYEAALEKFEEVLGSKPEPSEAAIASYNVACSYSKLGRMEAALSALEDALKAGYEDFKRVRTDPDLANLRKTDEFETLLKNYDESFINENAINAIKSLFGLGKK